MEVLQKVQENIFSTDENYHACLFYDAMEDYKRVAVDYIKEGLLNNELVICVLDVYREEDLHRDLLACQINSSYYIDL